METLRIKCPSCGIVLEVRNSKNEKVKKITCPNCQKQLAITFGDMAVPVGSLYEGSTRYQLNEGANAIPGIPSGLVELRVVRLKDGTPKHILRALTGEQKVKINGQSLMQDDEVVLRRGDDLTIEGKSFCFDKPQTNQKEKAKEPKVNHQPTSESPKKSQAHKPSWILGTAVALAIALTIVFFWPVNQPQQKEDFTKDSVISHPVDMPQQPKPSKQKSPKAVTTTEKTKDLSSLDLYSLELMANKNDVAAQYELGQRLVHASGSNNVVMGINWLHKASLNGSSQARQLKNKAVRTLQNKADRGDSVANSILQLIDTY